MARTNPRNVSFLFGGVASACLWAAPAAAETGEGGFAGWYARGGALMHPLLLCLVIGIIFIVERIYTLGRARVNARLLMGKVLTALRTEGVGGALAVCERTRGPVAAVLHAGLLRAQFGPDAARQAADTAGAIEVSFLERHLVVISAVTTLSPLFGLLGTAISLTKAFGAAGAPVAAQAVAGSSIPLIFGLSIAILCVIGRAYCAGTIGRLVLEMEEATSNLTTELAEAEKGHKL
jgi:biopolymer transport protein ExbB